MSPKRFFIVLLISVYLITRQVEHRSCYIVAIWSFMSLQQLLIQFVCLFYWQKFYMWSNIQLVITFPTVLKNSLMQKEAKDCVVLLWCQ